MYYICIVVRFLLSLQWIDGRIGSGASFIGSILKVQILSNPPIGSMAPYFIFLY